MQDHDLLVKRMTVVINEFGRDSTAKRVMGNACTMVLACLQDVTDLGFVD